MSDGLTYQELATFWNKARKVFADVCSRMPQCEEEDQIASDMLATFEYTYTAFKGYIIQEIDSSFDEDKFDEASGYTE